MMNDGKKLNTRASGVIAAAVMLSRVLGLVREVLELVSAWRARQTRERLRQLL